MIEWISIKDRLPNPETTVLIFPLVDLGETFYTANYGHLKDGKVGFSIEHDPSGYYTETFYPKVTHWSEWRQPQCFEGGPEKGCECPDHGRCLIGY